MSANVSLERLSRCASKGAGRTGLDGVSPQLVSVSPWTLGESMREIEAERPHRHGLEPAERMQQGVTSAGPVQYKALNRGFGASSRTWTQQDIMSLQIVRSLCTLLRFDQARGSS